MIQTEQITEALPMAVCGGMLAGNAFSDFLRRKILLWPDVLAAVCGLIFRMSEGTGRVDFLAAIAPGILFLLIGKLSGGKVGYGDGIVLLMTGCWIRAGCVWMMLFLGLFGAGAAGGLLIVCRRGRAKKTELPFVPFLFAGFGLSLVFGL